MKKYTLALVVFAFVFGLFINDPVSASDKGNLFVALNPSLSTPSQFLPIGNAGATNFTKATYTFTSTGGSSTITELKFNVNEPSSLFAVTISGGAWASVVNGVADLTGLNIPVENGNPLNLEAYVSYIGVCASPLVCVPSGTISSSTLAYVKYNLGGATSVSTPFVSSPTMKMVGSTPTVSLVPSETTLITGSNIDIGHIVISEIGKGPVTINQIPIIVSLTSDVTVGNNVVVMDNSGSVVSVATLSVTPNGVKANLTFPNGYLIPAEYTQTFRILLQINSVGGKNSKATLGLNSSYLFSWTDTAGGASAPVSMIDNSIYFYNYPTNTVSISAPNSAK